MTFKPLTPREKQILTLTMYGFTAPQVAEQLFISPNTVNLHFAKLQQKLHTTTKLHTVIMAISLGMIKPPKLKQLIELQELPRKEHNNELSTRGQVRQQTQQRPLL